jgi:hypothetical protein
LRADARREGAHQVAFGVDELALDALAASAEVDSECERARLASREFRVV